MGRIEEKLFRDIKVNPIQEMENEYRLPIHWMKEHRLARANRLEKQRIVYGLIEGSAFRTPIRYLDVGCGDGRWTKDISDRLPRGSQAFGIDISQRGIGFAKLICPEISWQVQKEKRLPYRDNFFDLVSAIEVVEHVPQEDEKIFIGEISRVTKAAGYFILTTPSKIMPLPLKHFRHYDLEYLEDLLQGVGFELIERTGFMRRCVGWRRQLTNWLNEFPMVWKLGKWYHREVSVDIACDLLMLSRKQITSGLPGKNL